MNPVDQNPKNPKPDANRQFYLGKAGQISGPFTAAQFEQMQRSGEVLNYLWFWDGISPSWLPVQAPPPLPAPAPQPSVTVSLELETPPLQPAPRTSGAPPPFSRIISDKFLKIQALFHDYRSIVSGSLRQVTADGCILASYDRKTTIPPFRRGKKIWLNLLDEQSGNCENLAAVIVKFSRRDEKWEYQIRWENFPKILS